MPSSRCICPACDAVFRLSDDVPAGMKVTCPECDKVFRASEGEDAAFDAEGERRPRRRKRPAPSGIKPLIVLLILVPVLLGIVGLVAGVGYLAWQFAPVHQEVTTVTSPQANSNVTSNPRPPVGNPPPQQFPPADPFEVGAVAPEIVGEDLDGNHFKLSDYRGKVVVLDFWGHW
jgi:predicted Zn finger-like uncharacterized protein